MTSDNLIYAAAGAVLHAVDGTNDTRVAQIVLAGSASTGSLDSRVLIHRGTGRVYVRLGSFPNPSNLVVVDGKRGSATINTIVTTINLGRENGSAFMAVDEASNRLDRHVGKRSQKPRHRYDEQHDCRHHHGNADARPGVDRPGDTSRLPDGRPQLHQGRRCRCSNARHRRPCRHRGLRARDRSADAQCLRLGIGSRHRSQAPQRDRHQRRDRAAAR